MIKKINELISYYSHDMKLKNKLLISHLILILTPILIITGLFYNQLFNLIVTNTKASELSVARETVTNLENTVGTIRDVSNEIVQDENFTKIIDNPSFQLSNSGYTDLVSFTHNVLSKVDGTTITDIKIYLDSKYSKYYEDSTLVNSGLYKPIDNIKNSYWHGIFASTNSRTLFSPTLYLTGVEKNLYGQLSFTRKITDENNQEVAYVTVYFNKAHINSLLKKYTNLPGSAKYIINDRDSLVGYSNNNLVGEFFVNYEDIPPIVPDTNKFETKSFSSRSCYISYKDIAGTNWIMISVIPVNSIWSDNKTIIIEFLIAYVLILAFAFVVSLSLSNSIVKRISNVIDTMRSVKTGKPTTLSHPPEYDEIGDLIETYNYMVKEINDLSDEQIRTAGELRTAEFKALQAQINPHFLYNTLDMINWLAKKGLNEDVSNAVQTLSKFYKMTLRKGNIVVTIEEELEHVSLYIQLQNMRYNNKIHFTVDIPDNMLEYTIPKIIFQPVIENAIQHGIFGKESKEGNIVIAGWLEDEILVFLISDDGIGIPEEKLEQLLTGNVQSTTGSGVAIANIHHRLQLFYDKEFGLSYHSIVGEYTEVEIRIPAVKYEEKH